MGDLFRKSLQSAAWVGGRRQKGSSEKDRPARLLPNAHQLQDDDAEEEETLKIRKARHAHR
jgi:hypothetical protein